MSFKAHPHQQSLRRCLGFFFGVLLLSVVSSWSPPKNGKNLSSTFFVSQKIKQRESRKTKTSLLAASSSLPPITSALLEISFDGTRFTGWSAANDPKPGASEAATRVSSRKRRRRRGSSMDPPITGYVRSVQGVLRYHLAKLYGNLDPEQIVVEASSRTDKGVHARAIIAMIYGLQQSPAELTSSCNLPAIIPGKTIPHPMNATDSSFFRPVPMDLPKLGFTLNRMLPPDIRIVRAAAIPSTNPTESQAVFHASTSAVSKTYVYTFAHIGQDHLLEPTERRCVWNIKNMGAECPGGFDMDKVQRACRILEGTYSFSSFQGAPRGATDREKRRKESGICTIESITVYEVPNCHPVQSMPAATKFAVEVTGNRFLYKMVRFLVGALVDIGLGNANLDNLESALQQKQDRNFRIFSCAPACGLVLHSVNYNKTFDWQTV